MRRGHLDSHQGYLCPVIGSSSLADYQYTLAGYLVQDRLLGKEDSLKNGDENCGAKM
jgi:hypothetical protein